jgi:hypothetical protein
MILAALILVKELEINEADPPPIAARTRAEATDPNV